MGENSFLLSGSDFAEKPKTFGKEKRSMALPALSSLDSGSLHTSVLSAVKESTVAASTKRFAKRQSYD